MVRPLPGGGRAPYPDDGPLAIAARVAFLAAFFGVGARALAPPHHLPHLMYSYHLEHFAAFFVLALCAAAAAQRRSLRVLGPWLCVYAGVVEFAPLFTTAHRGYSLANLEADIGGVMAALAAVAVGGFRGWFPGSEKP